LLALLPLQTPSRAGGGPIAIATAAAPMQPGEVVLVTITTTGPAEAFEGARV